MEEGETADAVSPSFPREGELPNPRHPLFPSPPLPPPARPKAPARKDAILIKDEPKTAGTPHGGFTLHIQDAGSLPSLHFFRAAPFDARPDSPEILQDSGEFFPRRQQPSILVHNLLCQPQLLDIITINKIHGGRLPVPGASKPIYSDSLPR